MLERIFSLFGSFVFFPFDQGIVLDWVNRFFYLTIVTFGFCGLWIANALIDSDRLEVG